MTSYRFTQVLCAVAFTGTAIPAAAEPDLKYENNSGGTVEFYGHLSPTFVRSNDGQDSRTVYASNDTSPSRIGLRLAQPFSDNLTFGVRLETGLGFAATSDYNQFNDPKILDWQRTDIRWADLSVKGDFGTFYAGQGSMAADGVTEYNFEGVQMAILNELQDENGGYFLRQSDGVLSTTATLGLSFNGLDPTRRGRIRYDSPYFSGFQFRIATGKDILTPGSEDKFSDAQIHYKQTLGNTKIEGGIGYEVRQRPGTPDRERLLSSVAVEFGSGFNFALASSRQHNGPRYNYASVGYNANFWSIGQTSFVIDHFNGEDYNVSGSTSKSWGIGAAQYFFDGELQVYVGYRRYDYQEIAVSFMEADNWTLGARWNF